MIEFKFDIQLLVEGENRYGSPRQVRTALALPVYKCAP